MLNVFRLFIILSNKLHNFWPEWIKKLMLLTIFREPSPKGSLGVDWPKFTTKSLAYVNFGTTLELSKGADEKDMKFWQGLYDHVKKIKALSSGWKSVLSFFERFWK